MFEQPSICTDDYGQSVYRCRYTAAIVFADDAVVIGARIPGVRARLFIAPSEEAKRAHKAEGIAFHEAEANCNTCRYLERVKHSREPAGFLFGRCRSRNGRPDVSHYADRARGDVMIFHPDDPMHMPCYASRWMVPDAGGKRSDD